MAIPAVPTNLFAQQGNAQVLLSWDNIAGATSYAVTRSTNGVTFTSLSTSSTNTFLDTTVSVNTQYWYQVSSVNASGTSSYTSAVSAIPTLSGQLSLGELRLRSQQKADRTNGQFVTTSEWNFFINQAYYELYDLLITVYEDYYVAPRLSILTDGVTQQYPLPNGQNYSAAPAMYKLFGVDLGLANSTNAWVTIKKFDFIARNRYVFPQITSTFLGVFNLRYRLVGGNIMFIPVPSGQQTIGLWYFPRLTTLLQDTDVMDGISGWTEYVIARAAKYALDKEESDTSRLTEEIVFLKQRIEESATNRDAGQPDSISDVRTNAERWGGYGPPSGDGSWGGA
jgi:hypothetical protein